MDQGCIKLIKVYGNVDPFDVYERIRPWVIKQRWYPKGLGEYTILDAWYAGGNIYVGILRAGDIKLFLPISVSDYPPPVNLPMERFKKINGYYVYEAEFDPYFHKLFLHSKLSGINIEFLEGEKLWRSIYNANISNMEAIETNSTNTLVKVNINNHSYVLKSYRSLSKYNLEPLFLRYLSGKNVVPTLYATAGIKEGYVAIMMENLEVIGDGGYPFYKALLDSLVSLKEVIPLDDIEKLTLTVALFHEEMARCTSWWCSRKRITAGDVSKWTRRIKSYYEKARRRTLRLEGSLRRIAIKLLRDSEPRIENAIKLIKEFRGKNKIRNHQDLHLGQILYTRNEKFYIIDFEGEPGRSGDERLVLEPALRDIACIIRSIGYIAVFALKDHIASNIINAVKEFLDRSKYAILASSWARKTATMFFESYIRKVMGVGIMIHGLGGPMLAEWAREVIDSWIVERALYEYMYELRFRPKYSLIPLLGLAGILP